MRNGGSLLLNLLNECELTDTMSVLAEQLIIYLKPKVTLHVELLNISLLFLI